MHYFLNWSQSILLLLCLSVLLSACSGARSLMSTPSASVGSSVAQSIILKPVTGLSDTENSALFSAIKAKAAIDNISILSEDDEQPEDVGSIIQGYMLNDTGAKTVSLVWDFFAPDDSRQQRFSETIPYADLGIPNNDQEILPTNAINALAALTVTQMKTSLGM